MMEAARFNPFGDDPRDRHNMLRWLVRQLNSISVASLDDESITQIDEIHDKIEELERFLHHNIDKPETSFANEFLDRVWPLWENYKEISENDVPWGIWRTDKKRILKHGYSLSHDRSIVREKSATAVNYYNSVPKAVSWDCIPITQKNRTFYVVKAKAAELNAVCSVPAFDKTMPTAESGRRVLKRDRKPKEWQRNPDPGRITAIETFIGEQNNIIANTPLVYAPQSQFVNYEYDETGMVRKVNVDFSFLHREGETFSDHKDLIDLRPLWLIDGQHRIRGVSQNPISVNLDIAFVFFPEKLGINAAAKIFAEVNTLARDLSDLHKMFMRHRFQLSSVEASKDFRPWKDGYPEQKNSRMNSLSYECAAYLTSESGSPLRECIQILDENIEGNHIIDAKMFVKNSRMWFSNIGPYPIDKGIKKEDIFKEVLNYFKAIEAVVNHYVTDGPLPWDDNELRWLRTPPKRKKNTLQNTRCFRAIIRLLPKAILACSGEKRPISQESFEKALAPLQWVDWNDQDLHTAYCGKTAEQWWKCLLIWMENAIDEGKAYPRDIVMSKEEKSKPGKGILSPPEVPTIHLEEGSPTWPTPNSPMVIISSRPINSYNISTWTLRDAEGAVKNPGGKKKFKPGLDSVCRFRVEHRPWMDSLQSAGKKMNITVDWFNANGEIGAGLELENPNLS